MIDVSFQLRNKAGVVKTFTFHNLAVDALTGTNIADTVIDNLLEDGHSIVVYGAGRTSNSPSNKDIVETEDGKQVECMLATCDGHVFLKQALTKNGKKYRSLECDKYDYSTDKDNDAGHSKVYIGDVANTLSVMVKTKGVDRRGRPKEVKVELPTKWEAKQATAYTEASEAEKEGTETEEIPF